LQRLLGRVDIQQTMAQAAAAESPSKTAMKLMQDNANNKELHAALDAAVETDSAVTLPQAAPWQQSDMAQIQEEMRVAMRQLAPDPAEFVLMLQQKSHQEKVSVQADAVERLKKDAVLAGQMWRRSVAVHEQIVGFLPRLTELLNDRHLWEQLKSEGQAMAAPNASFSQMASSERLAESFPRLISSGAAGLRRWGALESLRSLQLGPLNNVCPDREKTPKWAAEPGVEPSGSFGSSHGVSWSPASALGLSASLSFGIGLSVPKSKFQQEGLRVLQGSSYTVAVGISHRWASRDGYGAGISFSFSSPCGSDDPTFPFSGIGVSLSYSRADSKPELSTGSLQTSYTTSSSIGGGTTVTLAQPQVPLLAMTGYSWSVSTSIGHSGVSAGGAMMGWSFGLGNSLGLNRQGKISGASVGISVALFPTRGGFPGISIGFSMSR
jgi:hypothetical protein